MRYCRPGSVVRASDDKVGLTAESSSGLLYTSALTVAALDGRALGGESLLPVLVHVFIIFDRRQGRRFPPPDLVGSYPPHSFSSHHFRFFHFLSLSPQRLKNPAIESG